MTHHGIHVLVIVALFGGPLLLAAGIAIVRGEG